jgi:hypothetical protein
VFKKTPERAAPYVRVKLSNGATYTGFVGTYSPDLGTTGRELVLVPPLWSAAAGKNLTEVNNWSRIVLRSEDISVLMVDYRPKPSDRNAGAPQT